jgi:hypothetical protein
MAQPENVGAALRLSQVDCANSVDNPLLWGDCYNLQPPKDVQNCTLLTARSLFWIPSAGNQLLFSSAIHAFIRSRIPLSVHSLRAFSSLSISALMIATSPRESMTNPLFLGCHLALSSLRFELYPIESLDNCRRRRVGCADMVSKTEQRSLMISRIVGGSYRAGGPYASVLVVRNGFRLRRTCAGCPRSMNPLCVRNARPDDLLRINACNQRGKPKHICSILAVPSPRQQITYHS